MEQLFAVWAGLFGLLIGSFLNVLIYRIPRKLGFLLERSACPHCQTQLKWYHNIPLLSFVALRGKCAFCKKPIAWRYPLVELMNGLWYFYVGSQYGVSIQFFVLAYLFSTLLTILFIDLEHYIIPDGFTLPGMVLGLAVAFLPEGIGIINASIGLAVGGGSLSLVALLGDWLFKKESMGGGDIKLAAMLGAFLGWQKVLLIFLSSAVIGLVVSIAWMIVSEKIRQERLIPFGPFLAAAAVLAIVYGDQIVDYYVRNILGF